jgi:hypothetical protein
MDNHVVEDHLDEKVRRRQAVGIRNNPGERGNVDALSSEHDYRSLNSGAP